MAQDDFYGTQEWCKRVRVNFIDDTNKCFNTALGGLITFTETFGSHPYVGYEFPQLQKPISVFPRGMCFYSIYVDLADEFGLYFYLYNLEDSKKLLKKHDGKEWIGLQDESLCACLKFDFSFGECILPEPVTYSHPWLKHYYDKAMDESRVTFPNHDIGSHCP